MKKKINVKDKKAVATMIVAFVLVAVILAIIDTSMHSVYKLGYVGTDIPHHWSGTYEKLDGVMQKSMKPDEDKLDIDVTTEEGNISITIIDQNGNKVFEEKNIGNDSFTVYAGGKLNVTISAVNHKGSFDIVG